MQSFVEEWRVSETKEPDHHRSCPGCGGETGVGASFCGSCGQALLIQASPTPSPSRPRTTSVIDDEILVNLRGYKEYVNILCLECGYEGRMGVIRTQVPLIYSGWIWIPLVFTGVGILWLILVVVGREQSKVREVQCPCCKRHLVYPAGAKLRGRRKASRVTPK
jgi:hypothetical protein